MTSTAPATGKAPLVQIVLLNYGAWQHTIECLESVFKLDYPNFRVVVCDNASLNDSWDRMLAWARGSQGCEPTSESMAKYSSPPVAKPIPFVSLTRRQAERGEGAASRLIFIQNGANVGFAAGNNVALRYALARDDFDYIWLLNNDTVVAPDTLSELVAEASRDREVAAVGASIMFYTKPDVIQEMAGGRFSALRAIGTGLGQGIRLGEPVPPASQLQFVSGCSFLASRDVLKRVGLLDEHFYMYGEDLEWGIRARRLGLRFGYAPKALVWHKGSGTVGRRSPAFDEYNVRSAFLLSYMVSPFHAAMATLSGLYEIVLPKIVRRQPDRLRAVARGYRSFLRDTRRLAPSSPMRGRYLVKNRGWNAVLRARDALLEMAPARQSAPIPPQPRRMLIACGGHLGDAVVLTRLIAYVKQQAPQTELGLLIPSWAKSVVEYHPDVRWIHCVDHWRLSRAKNGFAARWRRYKTTAAEAIASIREVGYDVAVDVYPYYPNSAPILKAAEIPVRVGYTSGGFGSLYTHPMQLSDPLDHILKMQLALVQRVLPGSAGQQRDIPRGSVAPASNELRANIDGLLARNGLVAGQFTICHMSAGAEQKHWPRAQWIQLLGRLSDLGHRVVLTGRGARESLEARTVAAAAPTAMDLTDQLSWDGLVEVIRRARMVISVDTATAQVADALGVPLVGLWTGVAGAQWLPVSASSIAVTRPMPCAPCFRSKGCATMDCLRSVSVNEVLSAAAELVA